MKSLNEITQELNEGNVKLSNILRKESPIDFSKVSVGDVGVNEEGNFVIILDKGKLKDLISKYHDESQDLGNLYHKVSGDNMNDDAVLTDTQYNGKASINIYREKRGTVLYPDSMLSHSEFVKTIKNTKKQYKEEFKDFKTNGIFKNIKG